MKNKIFIGLLFLIVTISFTAKLSYAQPYEPEELPYLVGDVELSYVILNQDGTPHTDTSIDGIKTIRILHYDETLAAESYTLYLYIDRDLIITKTNTSLPYDFKWNFKGLSEGTHEFLFVLKSPEETIGILRLNLSIKH